MSKVQKLLNSHVSIRKFTNKEITEEEELQIISTAQRSPTSSNLQAYSIVGIRDKVTKNILAELSGNQSHVANSSLFLVFCADLFRIKQINEKKNYEFHGDLTEMFIIATVDASLAACRALISAQSLNIGGVMVGGIRNNPEEVCSLLNLPEFVYPVMGMSLGYPEQDSEVKPRLKTEGIYHKEKYSNSYYENVIHEYDKTIDSLGYLKDREVDKEKYPNFSELYSWSEHTARRMAKISRPHMKSFLESKGFTLK